jgi:hypothetical protein
MAASGTFMKAAQFPIFQTAISGEKSSLEIKSGTKG